MSYLNNFYPSRVTTPRSAPVYSYMISNTHTYIHTYRPMQETKKGLFYSWHSIVLYTILYILLKSLTKCWMNVFLLANSVLLKFTQTILLVKLLTITLENILPLSHSRSINRRYNIIICLYYICTNVECCTLDHSDYSMTGTVLSLLAFRGLLQSYVCRFLF